MSTLGSISIEIKDLKGELPGTLVVHAVSVAIEAIRQAVDDYLAENLPTGTVDITINGESADENGNFTISAAQVGADPSGTASSAVSGHNTDTEAHKDIRRLILSKVNVSDIVNDLVTNVANKPLSAAQGVALKALIDAIVVPTKVSQLTNDKGYLTDYTETDPTVSSWAKQAQKPSYTASEVGARPDNWMPTAADVGALPADTAIPEKTSDLTNDSGFITKVVTDLANYYKKTETYTQAQVNALVSAIPKFSISAVDSLPQEGISATTVYLLKSGDADQNLYTEYIFIASENAPSGSDGLYEESSGAWEKLGDQAVDLTGYAKETWVSGQLALYQPKGDYALASDIPEVPVQSVNGKTGAVVLGAADVGARPSTWMPSASDVGADPSGTATSAVSGHNTDAAAHNDIRLLIAELTTRLNAVANSEDTDLDQLAEIVAYIKSNKSLIDSITTAKVSYTDIIDNLTTNASARPLSAAQGVALKTLIDAITVPTKVSQLTNDANYLTEHQDISGKVDKTDAITVTGVDEDGVSHSWTMYGVAQ